MVRAAEAGVAAEAFQMEQKLEDEILVTAVKKLSAHRGDKAKQAEDMRELREMVWRDKRAVEVLTSVLGSSSGVSMRTSYQGALVSLCASSHNIALGSPQAPTEMSTRNLPVG